MVIAEIASGVTSLKATFDLAKAMVGVRDAATFQAKSIELQELILSALEKAIAAREAQAAQSDEIRALEAEVTRLKDWNAEKEKYELKPTGFGGIAFMLKPGARDSQYPHWLCPTCFRKGEPAFFQPTGKTVSRGFLHRCQACNSEMVASMQPSWS
jgi:hypothetical protein